jgi:hypothetical protein
MKFRTMLILNLILLTQIESVTAENIDTRLLQALGEINYHELESSTLQRAFHIFVDLPEDYQQNQEKYPSIYLLDGGNTFPLLSGFHHYLRFGDESPRAILVGISYGADTFREGNMRSTDYTAPSVERDFWGGAENFQTVLQDELIPLIESNYRADPRQRIIFGQSLGGQFVLYTAMTRPQLFFGHIASNPALHRNLAFFLKYHGDTKTVNATRLFVSSGEFDDPQFREPTLKWIEHWHNQPGRPWLLETRTLAGQTHMSAAPEAFRQGVKWIYTGFKD